MRLSWVDPFGNDIKFVDGDQEVDGVTRPGENFSCKAELVCIGLAAFTEHCGIEVTDEKGKRNYHVVSPNGGLRPDRFTGKRDTCDVSDVGPGRIIPPFFNYKWRIVETWRDPSGGLCNCVDRITALIKSKKLRYELRPSNTILEQFGKAKFSCVSSSSCNSNYTTHCVMKKCGIDSNRNSGFFAPGWNHRMKKCTDFNWRPGNDKRSGRCACTCNKWETIDDSWCADAPAAPVVLPVPKP